MSGTVRIKSASYRFSGRVSSVLTHKRRVSALNAPKKNYLLMIFFSVDISHREVEGLLLIDLQLKIKYRGRALEPATSHNWVLRKSSDTESSERFF